MSSMEMEALAGNLVDLPLGLPFSPDDEDCKVDECDDDDGKSNSLNTPSGPLPLHPDLNTVCTEVAQCDHQLSRLASPVIRPSPLASVSGAPEPEVNVASTSAPVETKRDGVPFLSLWDITTEPAVTKGGPPQRDTWVTRTTQNTQTTLRTTWEYQQDALSVPPSPDPERQRMKDKDITTFMIRNIPNKYSRECMLYELNRWCGLTNSFDFFYLPMDFEQGKNFGYAFINIVSTDYIDALYQRVHGRKFVFSDRSKKVCEVAPAKMQGLKRYADYYRHSPVNQMSEAFQPIFFKDGYRIPIPQ